MLSNNAKAVYKYLLAAPDHERSYNSIQLELHLSWNDVESACRMLVEHDLAFYKAYTGSSPNAVVLNENGRHRATFDMNRLGSFLFKSVLVPVIVAIITAIATTLITQHLFG